jgi:O-methyltransferase
MDTKLKEMIRPLVPKQVLEMKRRFYYYLIDETRSFPLDLLRLDFRIPFAYPLRKRLAAQLELANRQIICGHTHSEIVTVVSEILRTPRSMTGAVLEAGCFKGGSTAKLSLATQLSGRKLLVFDSFDGLPAITTEKEKSGFSKGDYKGGLEEVQKNVCAYGVIEVCRFFPGWFAETLPNLAEPIAVAFVDVDLADSLKTCLQYIYPKLVPDGAIFSHDGHLPLCVELMKDEVFWQSLGGPAPKFTGLGTKKLVKICKAPVR